VRHREAAERTLLTAIAAGLSPAVLADALLAAATERAFADTGHSLDFINKAFECLDLIGWKHAPAVLPTVVGQMVAARGAEESTAWRQPVDLIALCEQAGSDLPQLFAAGSGACGWSEHAALAGELLGDDPVRIVDALKAAIRAGAAPVDLSRSLAYAAALRMARTRCSGGSGLLTLTSASRPCAVYCTERWRSILRAISTCRRLACRARATNNSMTCLLVLRQSAPLCSTPSTGSDRSISRHG
jgi:hypothetical protein